MAPAQDSLMTCTTRFQRPSFRNAGAIMTLREARAEILLFQPGSKSGRAGNAQPSLFSTSPSKRVAPNDARCQITRARAVDEANLMPRYDARPSPTWCPSPWSCNVVVIISPYIDEWLFEGSQPLPAKAKAVGLFFSPHLSLCRHSSFAVPIA
jgi:hypothetical protein